jgi:hypothetical protein
MFETGEDPWLKLGTLLGAIIFTGVCNLLTWTIIRSLI